MKKFLVAAALLGLAACTSTKNNDAIGNAEAANAPTAACSGTCSSGGACCAESGACTGEAKAECAGEKAECTGAVCPVTGKPASN